MSAHGSPRQDPPPMGPRPHVSIVSGEQPEPEPADVPVDLEPEPPQEEVPPHVVGAAAREPVREEDVAAALDTSVAGKLRHAYERSRQAKRQDFPIPTVPGMIVVAKQLRDRAAYLRGLPVEAMIAKCTDSIDFVDEDGTRETVASGWGPDLARIMGVSALSATDMIRAVFSDEEGFLPVPLDSFAQSMLDWMSNVQQQQEQELGE